METSSNHSEHELLHRDSFHRPEETHAPAPSQKRVKSLLYTSHFLSTFNSRAFEFGAFLFIAKIYPQSLLPASIYALARAASAACLAPLVGRFVDRGERLRILRISIVGQRAAVGLSTLLLAGMVIRPEVLKAGWMSRLCLAVLSILACVEKLNAVMNTIAVERDWVVTIAGDHDIADDSENMLRTMNSQMRRIDLFCKLVAPLIIAFLDSWSTLWAIVIVGAMTICSLPVEYFAIAKVFRLVPGLRRRDTPDQATDTTSHGILETAQASLSSLKIYIKHQAFLPSMALALLYLTVLSFNGQMITYLIALGFSSVLIGALRGLSAIFELSATWIAPQVMARLGPIRAGIWFINYQILCVGIAAVCFWLPSTADQDTASAKLWATGAIAAVILSRTGLWGFDLSVQIIVQEEVEPELRGTFSSQEFAFQNIFEMLSFASTIIFAKPSQFKIPAAISAGAVATAAVLYAVFVRARRGHLVHWSKCIDRKEGARWQRLPDSEQESSA